MGLAGSLSWLHRETSMTEDCATSMSAPQGCIDDKDVVETFKEAVEQRIGADRYRMWFTRGVTFAFQASASPSSQTASDASGGKVLVMVQSPFAIERLRKNFVRELRAAAVQVAGPKTELVIQLDETVPVQKALPFDADAPKTPDVTATADVTATPTDKTNSSAAATATTGSKRRPTKTTRGRGGRNKTTSIGQLVQGATGSRPAKVTTRRVDRPVKSAQTESLVQPDLPELDANEAQAKGGEADSNQRRSEMNAAAFIQGSCNRLAHTAMVMTIQVPTTASPLFVSGPTGSGKTHLLTAIAEQFRRRHRMRRVIQMSAEQFTNDFITSVGNSGIASFRRRYREVDALLVDDVQFLGSKSATLREMLYTVETLLESGCPMIFSGNQSPTEIPGLNRELAGRLSGGLLCPLEPLDPATRHELLARTFAGRCPLEVPESVVEYLVPLLAGDGRVLQGVANMIGTLQRMFARMPSIDEIHQYCGDLLRAAQPVATLRTIESAVCRAFNLPDDSLRGAAQTRAVSEPRMLAMYLSRQLTSAAYSEIAGHFGGRSHSTAIAAGKNVEKWRDNGKPIGRAGTAMTVQQAIDRVESLLRSG